jgi:ubiquinone biosynthesis protein
LRLRTIAEALDPLIYKYDLRLPSYLALLGKTVTMLEGVALKVDPDFDVWAFSEPYLRKMSWRLALPHQDLSYELFRQGTEWADLIRTLPRVGNRLLARAEQGELIQIGPTDMEPILRQADRLTTRITLALLLAALTISLALLRTVGGGAIQAPVTAGYLVVTVLTAWLFISILRGTR